MPAATQTGGTATVVGLSYNSAFRTNVYATAGADGATMDVSSARSRGHGLRRPQTSSSAPGSPISDGSTSSSPASPISTTRHSSADVTAGSVVVGASKVDNASTDPTTLESDATAGGSTSVDGTYQISIYDSALFAAGGNFVIADGVVTQINGTYFNWDKLDGGEPACTLQFLWGLGMSPTPLADFASGVTFSDSYASTGSGVMEWTVTFTVSDNMVIDGTVAAVGSDFTDPDGTRLQRHLPGPRSQGRQDGVTVS